MITAAQATRNANKHDNNKYNEVFTKIDKLITQESKNGEYRTCVYFPVEVPYHIIERAIKVLGENGYFVSLVDTKDCSQLIIEWGKGDYENGTDEICMD